MKSGFAVSPGGSYGPQAFLRDMTSGLVSGLVTVCYSLSYAAMIFSGAAAGSLNAGVSMALTSASLTVILVALLSPFYFAIAGPDSRSAAVQSAIAASLCAAIATRAGASAEPSLLCGILLSTLFTGLVLWMLARLRMGKWIRYVPYPVVGGFLASTGWVLVSGGVRVMTGSSLSLAALPQLLGSEHRLHLIAGLLFAVVLWVGTSRVKHYLVLPVLLVIGGVLSHLVRLGIGVSLRRAQETGWFLAVTGDGRVFLPWRDLPWHAIDWSLIASQWAQAIALVLVTAVSVLVTAAALEVVTKSDADLDGELRAHGVANVVAGLCGGLVGSNGIGRSILNRQARAATRLSGVIAGASCLGVELIDPGIVGSMPRPVMGGTVLFVGMRLLDDWVLKGRRKLKLIDYLLVLALLVLVVELGFVAGLTLGVVVSCLIFAFNYGRISAVRHSFSGDEYASKVQRSVDEQHLLRQHGSELLVARLRGYLFFGSIVGLGQWVARQLASGRKPLRAVLLDFHFVNGMDASATLGLIKLRQTLTANGTDLWLSSLSADVQRGLLEQDGSWSGARTFADLDRALESWEDGVLARAEQAARPKPPFVELLGRDFRDADLARRFLAHAERTELQPNEYLFRQGDPASSIYLLESGRVSVVLERGNGELLRLRSITSHTTLGEMGYYRDVARSASVIAEEATIVHCLSREAIDRLNRTDPLVLAAYQRFVIRVLADRIGTCDRTIAALER